MKKGPGLEFHAYGWGWGNNLHTVLNVVRAALVEAHRLVVGG